MYNNCNNNNSIIIHVPNQQLQGHLQKQGSVCTITYIRDKQKHKKYSQTVSLGNITA
jgi:hypothetical protein